MSKLQERVGIEEVLECRIGSISKPEWLVAGMPGVRRDNHPEDTRIAAKDDEKQTQMYVRKQIAQTEMPVNTRPVGREAMARQ